MPDFSLDQLLADERDASPTELPPDFATGVLGRARRFRATMRRHWRLLTVASVVAIGVAVAISFSRAREADMTGPVPLQLFQSPTDTAPFATR